MSIKRKSSFIFLSLCLSFSAYAGNKLNQPTSSPHPQAHNTHSGISIYEAPKTSSNIIGHTTLNHGLELKPITWSYVYDQATGLKGYVRKKDLQEYVKKNTENHQINKRIEVDADGNYTEYISLKPINKNIIKQQNTVEPTMRHIKKELNQFQHDLQKSFEANFNLFEKLNSSEPGAHPKSRPLTSPSKEKHNKKPHWLDQTIEEWFRD